eukprot:9177297-Pyramimonas_sp.AAC.1
MPNYRCKPILILKCKVSRTSRCICFSCTCRWRSGTSRETNPIVRLSPSPHKKTDKEACFPRRIEDAKLGDYFLAFAEVKKLKSRKPPAKTWPHLDGWKPFSKPGLRAKCTESWALTSDLRDLQISKPREQDRINSYISLKHIGPSRLFQGSQTIPDGTDVWFSSNK